MSRDLLFALWFLLPAGVANVTPIFAAVLPGLRHWETPLDGGRRWRGKPILGPHKTWRGIITGIIFGTFFLWLQQLAVAHLGWAHYLADGLDYPRLPLFVLGPLLSLGALGGDAIESFFKRRRGRASGEAWPPFDQLDYVIGAIILSAPVVSLRPILYVWMVGAWFVIHLVASYLGYRLGLKSQPL